MTDDIPGLVWLTIVVVMLLIGYGVFEVLLACARRIDRIDSAPAPASGDNVMKEIEG